jgi:hypothetical protein
MKRTIKRLVTTTLLVAVVACGYQEDNAPARQYASAAEQLADEYGFADVDPVAFDRVVDVSRDLIMNARAEGVVAVVTALKQALALRRLDGGSLDQIQDFNLGQPLPGVGDYFEGAPDGISSQQQALTDGNVNEMCYECPPMDQLGSESCVQLVDAVVAQVKFDISPSGLNEQARGNLALDVHTFGIDVAAIRAEYTLRDAGVCDQEKIDGKEIARLRGIDDSVKILRKLIGGGGFQLAPQGGECKKIGPKGSATEAKIERAIDDWVRENTLCPDLSKSNDMVQLAEQVRREGIARGMDAHTTTIWVGTIREGTGTKSGTDYTVAKIDGCEAKNQVKTSHSPLVLDLDGDGLQLTTERVRFDLQATGQPQQVTWVGRGEGLLALDLNGDGRVTSGRELFGDHSDCRGEKCADGAAALAIHDHPALGGNADGRIDSADAVYDRLLLWVDHDQDGVSRASELSHLDDHGIRALSLRADYFDRRVPAGRLSLSLDVHTDSGPRLAYDVWFDNLVSPGFPVPLR